MKREKSITKKRKFKCHYCGSVGKLTFTSDPYASEIHNDESRHYFCDICLKQSADDI